MKSEREFRFAILRFLSERGRKFKWNVLPVGVVERDGGWAGGGEVRNRAGPLVSEVRL